LALRPFTPETARLLTLFNDRALILIAVTPADYFSTQARSLSE
jgi:hypothetical protein